MRELDKRDKEGVFIQQEAVGWEMGQRRDGYQLSSLIRSSQGLG